jgi:hypothetical protein
LYLGINVVLWSVAGEFGREDVTQNSIPSPFDIESDAVRSDRGFDVPLQSYTAWIWISREVGMGDTRTGDTRTPIE